MEGVAKNTLGGKSWQALAPSILTHRRVGHAKIGGARARPERKTRPSKRIQSFQKDNTNAFANEIPEQQICTVVGGRGGGISILRLLYQRIQRQLGDGLSMLPPPYNLDSAPPMSHEFAQNHIVNGQIAGLGNVFS